MDIAVGITQLLLAFVFMCAGGLVFGLEPAALGPRLRAWLPDLPALPLKLAGAAEFAAGAALLAPLAWRVPPFLAAAGAGALLLASLVGTAAQARRGRVGRVCAGVGLAALTGAVMVHHLP